MVGRAGARMSLSDKDIPANHSDSSDEKYKVDEVKKFIEELKEIHEDIVSNLHTLNSWLSYEFNKRLDKLAGNKLIKKVRK